MEENLAYAVAGDLELKLDIVPPTAPPLRAAILFLHGGGWRAGSKDGMRADAANMAAHGYVGLPAQYRLTGQAPWPAQIEDVKAAIRWTRANAARLDIDPDRILVWGSSAGAHLALMAAATPGDPRFEGQGGHPGVSSAVAGVIAVHPPTDLKMSPPPRRGRAEALLGEAPDPEVARAASPLAYVRADFPPTLFLHGTDDSLLHHAESQEMFDALVAAGASAELHLFHGHTHGFAGLPSLRPAIAAEAALFLDRTVLRPDAHRAEALEFSPFARADAARRAEQAGAAT